MAWLRPDFLPSDREPGLRRKGGSGVGTGPGAASTRRDPMAARSGFGSVIHPWGGGMGRSEISAIAFSVGSVGGESRAGRNSPYRAERTGRPMPASARIPSLHGNARRVWSCVRHPALPSASWGGGGVCSAISGSALYFGPFCQTADQENGEIHGWAQGIGELAAFPSVRGERNRRAQRSLRS
jgi:hypothetical protein